MVNMLIRKVFLNGAARKSNDTRSEQSQTQRTDANVYLEALNGVIRTCLERKTLTRV